MPKYRVTTMVMAEFEFDAKDPEDAKAFFKRELRTRWAAVEAGDDARVVDINLIHDERIDCIVSNA